MHVIVSSHALGDLPSVIGCIGLLSPPPASVVVSCDGVSDDVARFVRDVRPRVSCPVVLVQRPHKGIARRGQTRNNGVRAIRASVAESEMLYFLDGDVCPDRRHFEAVRTAGRACDVLIGRVIRLPAAASDAFRSGLHGADPFRLSFAQRIAFARKVGKAKVACWLRQSDRPWIRARLPPYWPDLRSGNFAVRAGSFLRVNGFDEAMLGWGGEDSDLGLRLYGSGAHVTTFPWGCAAFHLWHRSASGPLPDARLNERRSSADCRATHGLDAPFDQADSELQIMR